MSEVYKIKKKKNHKKYVNKNGSSFSLLLKKIGKFLTHKIYFMFIPHSKKKTRTLSISIYALIIIILLVSVALLSTFSFLTKNTIMASKTEILSGSYQDKLREINSFEEIFNSVVTNDYYRTDMSNVAKKLNIDNSNIDFNSSNYADNILLLNSRSEELEKIRGYLDELKANVSSKNNSLEPIPSILPIDSRYAVISRPYQDGSVISKGVGFETIAGTLIRATASGTVNSISYDKDTGFTITIYHRFGIITRYKGLATSLVSKNMDVGKGEILGNAKTGEFEYELRLATEYVNPLIFTTLDYEDN